jgi:ABC-type glycerol-3-phosphate transport system substrate-binding protein
MHSQVSRRDFLRVSAGAAAAGVLLSACTPATTTPAPSGQTPTTGTTGKQGKITMLNTAAYDPLQTPTDAFPRTPTALLTLRDEYRDLNPDADIEFIKWPGLEYWNTTLNTWLAGGTAPDVMPLFYHLSHQMYQNGQITNMEPYLAQPNPYIEAGQPGSEKWLDLFVPNYGATAAPDGNHYTVIFDANWVATYYNQGIFAELGVEAPETWAQLMDICQKAQDAGYTPYASAGPWITSFIATMLFSEKAKEIRMTPVEGFKEVTVEEMVRAYVKDIFTPRDPLWKESQRIQQELSRYETPGIGAYAQNYYISPDLDRIFLTGQSAMTYQYASFYEVLRNDTAVTWDYNHFWVPVITKESSEFATDAKVGSVIFQGNAMWAVPTFSQNTDLAIDWLMFISKPDNISRVVDDGTGGNFTLVNGYNDPRYPAFKEQLDLGFYYISPHTYGSNIATEYSFRLLPQLRDGTMTVDQIAEAMDQLIKDNVDQLIAENNWDTSKW